MKYIKPKTEVITLNSDNVLMSQSFIPVDPTPGTPAAREHDSWVKWENDIW